METITSLKGRMSGHDTPNSQKFGCTLKSVKNLDLPSLTHAEQKKRNVGLRHPRKVYKSRSVYVRKNPPRPPELFEFMEEFKVWCRAERGRAAMVSRDLGIHKQIVSYWRRGKFAPTVKDYEHLRDYVHRNKDSKPSSRSGKPSTPKPVELFEFVKDFQAWCRAERGRAVMVSRDLGIDPSSVSYWMRGKWTPKVETYEALREYMERHKDAMKFYLTCVF